MTIVVETYDGDLKKFKHVMSVHYVSGNHDTWTMRIVKESGKEEKLECTWFNIQSD